MTTHNNPYDYEVYASEQSGAISFPALMSKVYLWMTLALAMTAMTAYLVAGNESLVYEIVSNRVLFFGLIIAEFVVVRAISTNISSLSFPKAGGLFALYAILNGVTLSVVLLAYTETSVATTFFVTAGTFGAMSLFGLFTKRDLSTIARFLFMSLIGLILATLVNMIMQSDPLDSLLSYFGVLIFCGLTAYDTQKMKNILLECESENNDDVLKVALLCSLALYLDFINLFLYLLKFFGKRK